MRAGFRQREQAQLGKAAGAARGSRAAEALHQSRRVGQVDGGPVQADQATAAVPGARRAGLGTGPRHARKQLLERVGAEPDACLGDGGLVGQVRGGPGQAQPAQALQEAAQDLAVGCLGIQGQGDDVVDHQPGRQLALPLALPVRIGKHGLD